MNILLLRVGRLGDMIMILPAIREIIRLYPEAQLHAITSADGVRLLKTVGISTQNLLLYRNHIIYRLIDTYKVKRYIKTTKFDKIFCFESKKRTVSWLPNRATVIKNQLKLEHYATRCLKLINPSLEQLHQDNYLSFNAEKINALNAILNTQQITGKTILIGLHPTYSGFDKWGRKKEKRHRLWPWQNFAELSIRLSEHAAKQGLDLKIVMDLLPNERKIGLKIQQASLNNAILLPTEPDFQRYLCLIHRLNILIAPNTGVMHLAAAFNTPVVALFSELHPDDCGPYMPKEKFTVLRAEDTPNPAAGLAAISVTQVFESTMQLLEKSVI